MAINAEENLLETFKHGVQKNICLVPKMPMHMRQKAWLFWREVTQALQVLSHSERHRHIKQIGLTTILNTLANPQLTPLVSCQHEATHCSQECTLCGVQKDLFTNLPEDNLHGIKGKSHSDAKRDKCKHTRGKTFPNEKRIFNRNGEEQDKSQDETPASTDSTTLSSLQGDRLSESQDDSLMDFQGNTPTHSQCNVHIDSKVDRLPISQYDTSDSHQGESLPDPEADMSPSSPCDPLSDSQDQTFINFQTKTNKDLECRTDDIEINSNGCKDIPTAIYYEDADANVMNTSECTPKHIGNKVIDSQVDNKQRTDHNQSYMNNLPEAVKLDDAADREDLNEINTAERNIPETSKYMKQSNESASVDGLGSIQSWEYESSKEESLNTEIESGYSTRRKRNAASIEDVGQKDGDQEGIFDAEKTQEVRPQRNTAQPIKKSAKLATDLMKTRSGKKRSDPSVGFVSSTVEIKPGKSRRGRKPGLSVAEMTKLQLIKVNGGYKCSVCDKFSATPDKAKIHRRTHTKERPYHCTQCGGVFMTKEYLQQHEKLHQDKKLYPYPCNQCDKKYVNKWQLNHHVRLKHTGITRNQTSVACDECNKVLKSNANLRTHKRICHEEGGKHAFTCPVCGQGFSTKSNMKRHTASHLNLKLYECELCVEQGSENNVAFSSLKSLKSHQASHTGYKPFKCQQCEARFTSSWARSQHQLLHDDKRAYMCDLCGASFKQKTGLRSHQITHREVKPFVCDLCPFSGRTKGEVVRHQRSHTQEKPFSCQECGNSYSRPEYLKQHLLKHQGNVRARCDHCPKTFHSAASLKRHMQRCGKTKTADKRKSKVSSIVDLSGLDQLAVATLEIESQAIRNDAPNNTEIEGTQNLVELQTGSMCQDETTLTTHVYVESVDAEGNIFLKQSVDHSTQDGTANQILQSNIEDGNSTLVTLHTAEIPHVEPGMIVNQHGRSVKLLDNVHTTSCQMAPQTIHMIIDANGIPVQTDTQVELYDTYQENETNIKIVPENVHAMPESHSMEVSNVPPGDEMIAVEQYKLSQPDGSTWLVTAQSGPSWHSGESPPPSTEWAQLAE